MVKPTEEEKKNGWTEESLTEYLRSREDNRTLYVEPIKPIEQNHKYNPKRWRDG